MGKELEVNNGNSLCREIRTIFYFCYLKVCNFQLFFVTLRCKTNLNTNIMKEEKVNKRIGNLQLRKAIHLGKEPEYPSYHIEKQEPNGYYGNEEKFVDEGDYYRYPDDAYRCIRIHKSCFKNPETCYSIASFEWDGHEEIYELRFVGDRPLHLSKEEREIFWQLIELGEEVLNKSNNDEEED